jgi:hypothetical protein
VHRIIGALLLAIFAATQSGGLNYLHLQEHLAAGHAMRQRVTLGIPWPIDHHDERACPVCMTLHMPLSAAAGYIPLLICLGLLLAFLSLLSPRPATPQAFAWIESRGPPVG